MDSETWLKCTNSIKRHEGFRMLRYIDSTGNPSIGFGHKITSKDIHLEEVTEGQATDILYNDMINIQSELVRLLPLYNLCDGPRQACLLELGFNIGVFGLFLFKRFLEALSRNDFDEAAKELKDSLYHKQVGTRCDDIAYVIETGNI